MVECKLVSHVLRDVRSDMFVFPVGLEEKLQHKVPADFFVPLSELERYALEQKFSGAAGTLISIPCFKDGRTVFIVLVGLGTLERTSRAIEIYRRAVGLVIKEAQRRRIKTISMVAADHILYGCSSDYLLEQTCVVAQMAEYAFDDFFSDEQRKAWRDMTLYVHSFVAADRDSDAAIERGTLIGKTVNDVRHWVDTPPNKMTPLELADKAVELAHECDLGVTVFDEAKIKALGMGGLAAVSAGSDVDCRFVILEYQCGKPEAPTLALVGKGITFDSGGLSIKPAASMEAMKDDMSGAAAVIGTMRIVSHLKPHFNVIGFAPISENLPSGKATKPGDIIRFYNGKTAEVKNTDAEGRLILADALSYAVEHYKPDAIIDLATLTGACSYALGPFFSGAMGFDESLLGLVVAAGTKSGDRVWQLPFDLDYKPAVRSEVADICNIGNAKYRAGAITAGYFLSHFVGNTPWVHVDIAGTAFDVPDMPYLASHGATGAGVRLLVDVVRSWKK